MMEALRKARVAFQGEPGAFSEAAAVQLLGEGITPIPCDTFHAAFAAMAGKADALLVPVENSLAGSVVRVFDLLLESDLRIIAETILPIELQLIAQPGTFLENIRSVASHPMALAQCERLFASHPQWKRIPAEDTAGSVREVLAQDDKSRAAIASRRAAEHYGGIILREAVQDNAGNFTRFVLLVPSAHTEQFSMDAKTNPSSPTENRATLASKMSLALRLAHRPGALLAALEPFSRNEVNLLKIESRPIHGRPWEYQFFIDVESADRSRLDRSLEEARRGCSEVRVLGLYAAATTN